MENTIENDKQYEELLIECFEKIIKIAPKRCDVLKNKAKEAIDRVKSESPHEKDANKYFFIMKMALDIRNTKLMVQVLSYIQKLISHDYLDGNCKDNCIYDENTQPDTSNCKYPRKLIDAITESICQCVEEGDADVHLQVIKCLVTIVATTSCKVHDSSLLDAFRACYKIHLSTSSTTNESVSKVSLHQMMTIVFQKMEAYSGNFGVDIQTIQKSLEAKFENRKKQITRLQRDFGVNELAVSSFFNEEEDSNSMERSREDPERVGTQINFSAMDQYLYMLCQNMVDNVCIYHDRAQTIQSEINNRKITTSESKEEEENNRASVDDLKEILNDLNLKVISKNQRKSKVTQVQITIPNEKGIGAGKFGWCTVCRKAAELYCKDTYYPICSLD